MKNATTVKMQTLVLVAMLVACTPATLAQKGKPAGGAKSQTAAAAAEAAPKSPCGNQSLCYDTADFTATISQFRTSTDSSGNKMLDAIVHFQNKTDQVLSLAYADGSAESLDDHGNRYELNKNGVRGMGTVTGTTPDAKFVLQPNGTGDARFELMWNPKDQIAGATYGLEMSIREMSRGDDKQWTLGNEVLVHYDGLTNGSASASVAPTGTTGTLGGGAAAASEDTAKAPSGSASGSPSAGSAFMSNLSNGATAATQPCGTATAKAAGAASSAGQSGAADAVSSTTTAITSISSLFGHKKAAPAPAAATNVASASPCAAATNVATGGGSTAAPKSGPMAQPAATASAAAAPAATVHPATASPAPAPAPSRAVTKPVPARQTGVVNALMKQPVAPTNSPKAPAPATSAAKTPAAVPATKKPTPVPSPATATAVAK
jgi:hypothetical protein